MVFWREPEDAPVILVCPVLVLAHAARFVRLVRMAPPDAYVMFNNIPRVGDAQRFEALSVVARDDPATAPESV